MKKVQYNSALNRFPASRRITRSSFLRGSVASLGAAVISGLSPSSLNGQIMTTSPKPGGIYDLREFMSWLVNDFEPSVRLPGPAGRYSRAPGQADYELYGTCDMACVMYTLGRLNPTEQQRSEWVAAIQSFQREDTGYLVEKAAPTHGPMHNTAFALAALQLFDATAKSPLKFAEEMRDPRAYLRTLNWETRVYPDSHFGAGIGAIHALSPALNSSKWFADYFAACDELFDPNNGMMGLKKPAGGDFDQIGGTFHYSFIYTLFNRRMPFPEKRIDSILSLQRPDGYWDSSNRTWLTLDAIYLLTRTLRYCPHRADEIHASVRRAMDSMMVDMYSAEGRKNSFSARVPVHSATCAVSIAAEVQQFLGADKVITEWPLRLVLDRRPFI
jgi:hypothetical protein